VRIKYRDGKRRLVRKNRSENLQHHPSRNASRKRAAYADGSSYGVEAGYYANAGTAGNKTIGITAPTGMTWALAAVEVKGNPTSGTFTPCNTVTTSTSPSPPTTVTARPLMRSNEHHLINASCTSSDPHTIQATLGQTGDTTRIVYTKGYYYTGSAWTQYSGTCTGASERRLVPRERLRHDHQPEYFNGQRERTGVLRRDDVLGARWLLALWV
jgi:hypothetical protein